MRNILLDMDGENACGLSRAFFCRIVEETLDRSCIGNLTDKTMVVGVESANPQEIAQLALLHFGKRKSTDILSFPVFPDTASIERASGGVLPLGEIVLCEEVIRRDARSDGVSYERAMAFVFSHGVLHLLGFDHSEEMFGIQDAVCDEMRS
jgi:probable rRNA maturation factor